MKLKIMFKMTLFISATAFMFSCGPSESKKASSSIEDSTAKAIVVKKTPLDTAICFINRFKNENEYFIPSAWLFEKGIKNMIDSIDNLKGIKFYAAINNNRNSNEDTLTLVMIPVISNAIGNKIDYINDNYFYEFSDLCPPKCSEVTVVKVEPISSNTGIQVGDSWYFSIDKFKTIFNQYKNVNGVRLYRFTDNDKLNLKMVPVVFKNDTTYNDIKLNYEIIADEICIGGNNCDETSVLYNPTNCPI